MIAFGKNSLLILVSLLVALPFVLTSSSLEAQTPAAETPVNEKINVFAVVSPEIETACLEAARTLMQEESLESFPLQGFQIHCTLYMTQ